MKISGPFSKPRPAPEPRIESAVGKPGSSGNSQTVGQRVRPGGSSGDYVLVGSTTRSRDGFEAGTKPRPALLGEGNRNIFRGSGDESPSTVPAGSLHTLPNRLGGVRPRKPGPETPAPTTGEVRGKEPKQASFLTKDALESLQRPELTDRMVRKLSKAKTLEKVAKLTRWLPPDLQDTIMKMASIRPGSSNANNILV